MQNKSDVRLTFVFHSSRIVIVTNGVRKMKNIEVRKQSDGSLYSRSHGRYINRLELFQAQRKGALVSVVCTKSKLDVTVEAFAKISICTFCDDAFLLKGVDADPTCCAKCDDDMEAEDAKFQAIQTAKFGKRPCRSCGKPNSVGRYYECLDCVPESARQGAGDRDEFLPNNKGLDEVRTLLIARAKADREAVDASLWARMEELEIAPSIGTKELSK
jgi:hypothetical protein